VIIYKIVLAEIQHNVKRGVQGEQAKFRCQSEKNKYIYENCTAPRVGAKSTKITKHINLHELRGPQSRDGHPGGCVWEPLGLIEEQKISGWTAKTKLRCSQLHPGGLVLKSKTKL
jgi:hypothetical protein